MTSVEMPWIPEDPTLAECATVLSEAGHWAVVLDARWRVVAVTKDLLASVAQSGSPAHTPGAHWFGPQETARKRFVFFGNDVAELLRQDFRESASYVLHATPGGRDELRRAVDPLLQGLVEEVEAVAPPAMWSGVPAHIKHAGSGAAAFASVYQRVHDSAGTPVGLTWLSKPRMGMTQLAAAVGMADLGHVDRMALVDRPDRRPAAVLMADLEASSPLSRRLSTAQYFAFGRRLVRTADQCIVDHGGIVGRHAGDGIVAFFLAETTGSESAAARACIETARALRGALAGVTERTGIEDTDVSLRFGLHWGATLYVGRITTVGRTEVTALGDEVNETARIEACATGSRTIASKPLIERLTAADAEALGIDPNRTTYTPLGDLPTATDKARRDAPTIAVCDLTN